MTRFRVVRHPLVDRDIARIAAFLLEFTTPRSVTRKIAALDADVDALGESPYRGTKRDEISPGLRAIPSAGKGVIAFDIKEDTRTVRILSITWGGADWMGKIAARVVRGAAGRNEKRVPGPRGPGPDAAGDREPFLIRRRDRDVIRRAR